MRKGSVILLLPMLWVVALVVAPAALADDLIYDQPPIDAFDATVPEGTFPDDGGTDGATDGRYLSDPNIGELDQSVARADDFTIDEDFTLTDIHWWGSYSTGVQNDHFTLSIYSALQDVDGAVATDLVWTSGPDALIDSMDLDGLVDYDNPPDPLVLQNQYFYTYFLPTELDLAAGTYYLSIVNDTGLDADWYWNWGEPGNGMSWYLLNDDTDWYANPDEIDLAFQLTGTTGLGIVPEPASMSLLALGLAGLAVRRYRRVN